MRERERVEGDFDGAGAGERTGDLRGGGAGVRGDLREGEGGRVGMSGRRL